MGLLPPTKEKNEEGKEEMEKIIQSVAFKSEEEISQQKNVASDAGATSATVEPEPNQAGPTVVATTATASIQNISTASASSRPRASAVTNPSSARGPNPDLAPIRNGRIVESRGVQVYDVLIMLLVAAIAALLARRINLMQDSGSESNFPADN